MLYKRIISFVISMVMTWVVASVTVKYSIDEAYAVDDIIYGDLDNDKIITAFDMIILRNMYINKEYDISADLDGNDCINFVDLSLLNDFLLGKRNTFPVQFRSKIKNVSYELMGDGLPVELSLNKELLELTDELGTPLEAYNYIYNNINTSFYTNSRKGAIGTFDEKLGNDVDQASLLIAMLTHLGYKADYATYEIGITEQQLLDWTGCQSIEAALKVIEYGNAEIGIYIEMEPVRYVFQHTIVKALIDDSIVYLDTSFKKYKKVSTVYDELGWITNEDAFTELVNNELSFFDTDIDEFMFDEVQEGQYYFTNSILEKNTFNSLPSDFEYDLINVINYNPLDEMNSDTITFYFGDNKKTIKSAELYGKNISVCFENVFGNIFSDYVPFVKIDENVVLSGSKMQANQTQDLGIIVFTNKYYYNYTESLTAGEMCSICLNYEYISSNMMSFTYTDFIQSSESTLRSTDIMYQGINEENEDMAMSILYTSDNIGKLLRHLGVEWFSEASTFNGHLREMSNVRNENGLSFALVSYSPIIENNKITKKGTYSTNIYQLYRSIERDNNVQKVKSNNIIRGMFESTLEKKILKKYLGTDMISTLDIFQQAEIQNIEICKINKDNLTALNSLNLNIPSNEINSIKKQIDAGNTILIPSSFIKIDDWGGIGYISIAPSEESAFYYRFGGYGYNGESNSFNSQSPLFFQSANIQAVPPIAIPFPLFPIIVASALAALVLTILIVVPIQLVVNEIEEQKETERFFNEAREIQKTKTETIKDDLHYQTYFHATSMESALKIQASLRIYPTQNVDGGLVYAWKICPDERAVANSGSQKANVIVRFESIAAFEMDPTITDDYAMRFIPIRACIAGPITIKNPVIIPNLKKSWFRRVKEKWS